MNDGPQPEFVGLLARARAGDEGALAQLSRQYEAELRIVARAVLGQALRPYLDSMDLMQSVHRSLLIGLRDARFDISNPKALIALALTMVRRKAARHWRKLQRQQRLNPSPTDSGNLPSLLAGLASPETDPIQATAVNEAMQNVFKHLDATERRMLELRMQGHSTAEVARELGLDGDVLRVRLSRLRQRLHANGVLNDWL